MTNKGSSKSKRKAPKSKGRAAKGRLVRLMTLQEQAVKDWGEYAQEAARLMAKGTMHPGPWMQQYTRLSRRVVENFTELVHIISGS